MAPESTGNKSEPSRRTQYGPLRASVNGSPVQSQSQSLPYRPALLRSLQSTPPRYPHFERWQATDTQLARPLLQPPSDQENETQRQQPNTIFSSRPGQIRPLLPPPGLENVTRRIQANVASSNHPWQARPIQPPPGLENVTRRDPSQVFFPNQPWQVRPLQPPPGLGYETQIPMRQSSMTPPANLASLGPSPINTTIDDRIEARFAERYPDPDTFPRDTILIPRAAEIAESMRALYTIHLEQEQDFQRELMTDLIERKNRRDGIMAEPEKVVKGVNDYFEDVDARLVTRLINEHHMDVDLHYLTSWSQRQYHLLKAILQTKHLNYYGVLPGLNMNLDDCIHVETMRWHLALMKRRTDDTIRQRATFIEAADVVQRPNAAS